MKSRCALITNNVLMQECTQGKDGGMLADKLRSMLQLLIVAEHQKRVLLIHHTHPLPLEGLLAPSGVLEWKARSTEASKIAAHVVSGTLELPITPSELRSGVTLT